MDLVDELILCDDASKDSTFELAKELGIQHCIRHENNLGYGGNQKHFIQKHLKLAQTSLSCCIPITNTLQN